MRTCDVAIVGGGIVGAACALEFAEAGLRVELIEHTGIGTGATNAGHGHLVVMDDNPAQFALTRYSLSLWQPLLAEMPADCEYWRCGTCWVAADEEELAIAARRGEFYNRSHVIAQLLDSKQLAEAEPNLRPNLKGALLVEEDVSVRPPAVAEYLFAKARVKGANLIDQPAVKISDEGVLFQDGSLLYAGSVINAIGADAPTLVPGLPIRPRKGHILVVDAGQDFARHQVMELGYLQSTRTDEIDSVAFNVRHNQSGELLIGSSRQFNVTDPKIEPSMIRKILKRAIEYMPGIAQAKPVRSWTGFRAATPDGLPLIGLCPGFTRVYAATGHEGLGATTATGTARLLLDTILGQDTEINPEPYLPSRFEKE